MEQVWLDKEQGLHALFRDETQVSERQRRPMLELLNPNEENPDMATMNKMIDLLIMALLADWNREEPISLDAILDLPAAQYDALRNAAMPKLEKLVPDFGVNPDPDATTPTDASDA